MANESDTETIEPGTGVYDRDGRAWEYVVAINDGHHIVRAIYQDEYGDQHEDEYGHYCTGALVELQEVWVLAPPTQHMDKKHARIRARIDVARKELREVNAQVSEAKRQRDELGKITGILGRLDDLLKGQITHDAAQPHDNKPAKRTRWPRPEPWATLVNLEKTTALFDSMSGIDELDPPAANVLALHKSALYQGVRILIGDMLLADSKRDSIRRKLHNIESWLGNREFNGKFQEQAKALDDACRLLGPSRHTGSN